MHLHILTEKLKKLGETISLYSKKNNFVHLEEKIQKEDDINWAASHLYAEILYYSKEGEYYTIDYAKLITLRDNFNRDFEISVDVDELIEKDWIRIVYGMVTIPNVISSVMYGLNEIIELKKEIEFLLTTENPQNETLISKIEFEAKKEAFEEEHKIKLNLEKAEKKYWSKEKDDKFKIHNVHYYKPVLDNLDTFKFIKYLCEHLSSKEDENKLCIDKTTLNNLITKHRRLFYKTPTIETFLTSEKLEDKQTKYIISFRNYDWLSYKTGAILWEKLLGDDKFKDDETRIRFWYNRMIHHESRWCSIKSIPNLLSLNRFINAAYSIIETDKDLSFAEKEFTKLKLDQIHSNITNLEFVIADFKIYTFPNDNDLFEMYWALNDLDKWHQSDLLYMQSVRNPLTYFIHQIVRYESFNDFKKSKTLELLLNCSLKSFILWKVCNVIYEYKPEIIPLLFLQKETMSLGFYLLWKIKIADSLFEKYSETHISLIKTSFKLVLESVTEHNLPNEEKAKIMFQCLLKAISEKFTLQRGIRNNVNSEKERAAIEVVNQMKLDLSKSILPGRYFNQHGQYDKLLLPELIEPLLECVKNYSEKDVIKNHTLSLPYFKLELYSWLLIIISKDITKEAIVRDDIEFKICEAISEEYLSRMNCFEIDGWDYSSKSEQKKLPSWHSYKELNDLINWGEVLIVLEKYTLAEDFISPDELKLKKADDVYNEYNRFTADKIRTHLLILISSYNDIYFKKSEYSINEKSVESLLNTLENKISFYVTRYCFDAPKSNRIDIFSNLFERTYGDISKQELLPVIGDVIKRLSSRNKEKIIKELIKSNQLLRCLKLFKYLVSEKDIELFTSIIKGLDIKEQLEGHYSINDLEFIMQELAKFEGFIDKAKEALVYWENKIPNARSRKDEYITTAFRIKLLIAYHSANEKDIQEIEVPKFEHQNSQSKFNPYHEKDFYRALVYLKIKEPNKAYQIFHSQLTNAREDRPTLALNRFASKLQWAEETESTEEKETKFSEALNEWNEFEKGLSKEISLEYIKDKIWYNKLHAYIGLSDNENFDKLYYELEETLQIRSDFLELRIQNLVKREMRIQAEKLMLEAEEYHRLENGNLPEFIYKIRALIDSEDSTRFLQQQFLRIFSKSPEEIIKIIPEDLNKNSELSEFILNEIVDSANDLLTYINSISEIRIEDKYSDLLTLSLNGRLRIYGWRVGNARGGYSDSTKMNPGEIDFAIFSKKEKIAICEAMVLEGKNTSVTQTHNFKIFNYDHSRKMFYMITYFLGDSNKFDEHWEKYKTGITSLIEFPKQYELVSNSLDDVSNKFGIDSIKVAKGTHKEDIVLYHVFISINYKLTK